MKNFKTLLIRLLLTVLVSSASLLAAEPPVGTSALRVGVCPNMAPMIFKEGKSIVGLEADLAKLLGQKIGRSISFVPLPWPDLIDSLEANEIDIIMSSMSITHARQARVAFCDPYLRIGQMALVRADEKYKYPPLGKALAGQKFGVIKATTGDLLLQQEFPRASRKYFDSGDEAAKALAKKKINLYVTDSTMAWYLAGKYEDQGLVVAPTVFSEEMLAWAIKRSDGDLLASANKALRTMVESGELNQAVKRWIPRFK